MKYPPSSWWIRSEVTATALLLLLLPLLKCCWCWGVAGGLLGLVHLQQVIVSAHTLFRSVPYYQVLILPLPPLCPSLFLHCLTIAV